MSNSKIRVCYSRKETEEEKAKRLYIEGLKQITNENIFGEKYWYSRELYSAIRCYLKQESYEDCIHSSMVRWTAKNINGNYRSHFVEIEEKNPYKRTASKKYMLSASACRELISSELIWQYSVDSEMCEVTKEFFDNEIKKMETSVALAGLTRVRNAKDYIYSIPFRIVNTYDRISLFFEEDKKPKFLKIPVIGWLFTIIYNFILILLCLILIVMIIALTPFYKYSVLARSKGVWGC